MRSSPASVLTDGSASFSFISELIIPVLIVPLAVHILESLKSDLK